MKLKTKKKGVSNVKESSKPAPKAADTENVGKHVITPDNFAGHLTYVGRKIPTAVILKECKGLAVPTTKLKNKGYLVVHGDKPGIVIRACLHDGDDRFMYHVDDKPFYGSVNAFNSVDKDRLRVEILDRAGLKALAKKIGKAKKVERRADKKEFTVVLLNPFEEQYVAGLYVTPKGHLGVLNMEHREKWNKPKDQFTPLADANFKQVFAELAKV